MIHSGSTLQKLILLGALAALAGCSPVGSAAELTALAAGGSVVPVAGTWTPLPTHTPTLKFTSTTTSTPTFTPSPTPAFTAIAVAAGKSHTCVITDRGGVKCWGENEDGQLGNGTTVSSGTAVDVAGLDADVTGISAGYNHTCAALATGVIKCWGNNAFGQLGDGTQVSRNTPVSVVAVPIEDEVSVTAGGMHSCALTKTFGVWCWGIADYKILDGEEVVYVSPMPFYSPVNAVPSGDSITAIVSGGFHDCVLTSAGGVMCWGYNGYGQLGRGETSYSGSDPDFVQGLAGGVAQITAGGMHTCARMAAGGVKCWGYDRYRQTGGSADGFSAFPRDIAGLSDASMLTSGGYHSCAIVEGGSVRCWGDNRYGQLNRRPGTRYEGTSEVPDLPGAAMAISAGGSHTCALLAGGRVVCWGLNKSGQVGETAVAPVSDPTRTKPVETEKPGSTPPPDTGQSNAASSIAAGRNHTCAVTAAGGVRCWGKNEHGELGRGSADSGTPVAVTGLSSGVQAVVAGWGHTCALTKSGGVKCWGYNKNGELGNGTNEDSNVPVDVRGLSGGVTALEAADDHTCALLASGAVKCWGFNMYGQLGDGTPENRNTPVEVVGLSGTITALAAGWGHTCALSSAGGVKCWGNNEYGQLGVESKKETIHTPVIVSGLASGVKAISADGGQTCAITEKSLVMCWGNNKYGQLGDGTAEVRKLPIVVAGLPFQPVQIAAGWNHTCAVDSGGKMACWGWNYYGQLGNGFRTTSTHPVRAGEVTLGVSRLSLGWGHMCVITETGGVQCWGLNEFGQVGDGTNGNAYLPVDVLGLTGG